MKKIAAQTNNSGFTSTTPKVNFKNLARIYKINLFAHYLRETDISAYLLQNFFLFKKLKFSLNQSKGRKQVAPEQKIYQQYLGTSKIRNIIAVIKVHNLRSCENKVYGTKNKGWKTESIYTRLQFYVHNRHRSTIFRHV